MTDFIGWQDLLPMPLLVPGTPDGDPNDIDPNSVVAKIKMLGGIEEALLRLNDEVAILREEVRKR